MMTLFIQQTIRELLLNIRQVRMIVNSALFFLMVMIFFPLTMPPDTVLLRTMLPGLVWITVLLALLLSSERLFQQDYEDGVMEQWLVSGFPVSVFVSAKVLVQWCLTLIPILLFIPILAVLFGLSRYEALFLMLSLACGTPAMFFLSAMTAAFGIGLQQKGVFMALILLPLAIPVMIFGSGTLTAAMQGLPVAGYLALLLAMSLIGVSFLPFAVAGIIRISLANS
jgi:heme exporter protein B